MRLWDRPQGSRGIQQCVFQYALVAGGRQCKFRTDEAHGAPPTTAAQRKTRAELLMKAQRYADAADGISRNWQPMPPLNAARSGTGLRRCLASRGRNREAKAEITNLPGANAEQSAHRLYILGEVAWATDENDDVLQHGRPVAAVRIHQPMAGSRRCYRRRTFILCITNTTRRSTASANCSSVFPMARKPLTRTGRLRG